jgi:hypothetical protein
MTNTKQVLKMPPGIAAYIAGLIDGEGTITLARRHRSDKRQLVVSIANTDHGLLRFVLEAVGAGKITRKRSPCYAPCIRTCGPTRERDPA